MHKFTFAPKVKIINFLEFAPKGTYAAPLKNLIIVNKENFTTSSFTRH
jgi:hypothetical protein